MPRWDEEQLERTIKKLTAERDRYKAALEAIADEDRLHADDPDCEYKEPGGDYCYCAARRAAKALKA